MGRSLQVVYMATRTLVGIVTSEATCGMAARLTLSLPKILSLGNANVKTKKQR